MIEQDWQRALLRVLEEPLPLVPQPFRHIAERCGVSEEDVLNQIQEWRKKGVMRRFGARIVHHHVGFISNGMSVWNVPDERLDEVGTLLAAYPQISHCYARTRTPEWRFNLFAMIHGHERKEVARLAQEISEKTGITDYDVLFTQQELKKTAPRLFPQPLFSGNLDHESTSS